VEVGADGEILPPEKVAVVEVPKAVESAPGLDDPDDVAIAAVPKPSPSPMPSPSPSPTPKVMPSPTPSPVVQLKPKPVVQTPARSTTAKPVQKSQSQPVEPKQGGNSSQPSIPQETAPDPRDPVKGREDLPPPPRNPGDITQADPTMDPPVKGRQASLGGIEPLDCVKDCTTTNNVKLLQSPQELVPVLPFLSGQTVTVVALFDRDRGTLLPGSTPQFEPGSLTLEQYTELSRIISLFVEKCQFQFEATDTVAIPPPVRLELKLTINIK
jgi:hypothetical protein